MISLFRRNARSWLKLYGRLIMAELQQERPRIFSDMVLFGRAVFDRDGRHMPLGASLVYVDEVHDGRSSRIIHVGTIKGGDPEEVRKVEELAADILSRLPLDEERDRQMLAVLTNQPFRDDRTFFADVWNKGPAVALASRRSKWGDEVAPLQEDRPTKSKRPPVASNPQHIRSPKHSERNTARLTPGRGGMRLSRQ